MQPKIVAKVYGPGPLLALMNRKNIEPRKVNTAIMTVSPASRYAPVNMAAWDAVYTRLGLASKASLIAKHIHL